MRNIFQWFVLGMFFILSLFMFSRLSIRNLKMTTKYQVSWESMGNWLTGVSNDNYKAFCKACWQEFSIKQNGKEKVKQNEKSAKHQKVVIESKSQTTLGCSQTGSITVSKSLLQDQMSLQQLIAKAEVIQALHVVESNQSFRSTDKDSERFREQFPDSKIAAGYSMHADKTQYIIVYRIAPFIKDFIIHDANGKCFTYKFDGMATSKVEKQYDGYITHFSDS